MKDLRSKFWIITATVTMAVLLVCLLVDLLMRHYLGFAADWWLLRVPMSIGLGALVAWRWVEHRSPSKR
ncbi:hypothetical protein GCM10027418_24100 [Mariniluteicoccus endophyticus]